VRTIILLLLTFLFSIHVQAQMNETLGKKWFWSANVGTRLDVLDSWSPRLSSRGNVLGQFSIGTERSISEKWSFVQTYRLQLLYSRFAMTVDTITFFTPQRTVDVRLDGEWGYFSVRAEVPVYWRYRLGKKVSLTGGAYGSISLLEYVMSDVQWDAVDPDDDFEINDTMNEDSWLSYAQVGLEGGLLFRLNERMDLRLNVQQVIFSIAEPQPQQEVGYVQTAILRPNVSVGTNVRFK
jgi:hypothetical protein